MLAAVGVGQDLVQTRLFRIDARQNIDSVVTEHGSPLVAADGVLRFFRLVLLFSIPPIWSIRRAVFADPGPFKAFTKVFFWFADI